MKREYEVILTGTASVTATVTVEAENDEEAEFLGSLEASLFQNLDWEVQGPVNAYVAFVTPKEL